MRATPIRVLMLLDRYWPHVGGSETVAKTICDALSGNGCRFSVVARNYSGTLPKEEVVDGVPVIRFGTSRHRRLSKLQFALGAAGYLIRHRDAYDVLHVHLQQYDVESVVTFAAWCLTRKPYVVHIHRSEALPWMLKLHGHPELRAFRPNRLPRRLFTAMLRRARAVVVVDRQTEALAARHRVGRCVYVPNAARSAPRVADQTERAALRGRLGLPRDAVVAVSVGVLRPEKNHLTLLQAWHRATERAPHVTARLIMLGGAYEASPETAEALRAYAARQQLTSVEFRGHVDNVPDILRVADFFVHPSLVEGASLAILEAMSAGLPVVVSDIPGNRDLVPSEEIGLLFEPTDAHALASRLERLLQDESLRRTLGAQAQRRAREMFGMERVLAEIASVYAEAGARNGRARA